MVRETVLEVLRSPEGQEMLSITVRRESLWRHSILRESDRRLSVTEFISMAV